MPSLDFKGKSFVYTHHLSVPFRELVVAAHKSLSAAGAKPSLADNFILHGDILHALKALLPLYAGKVDCIYIDPLYNTGKEGRALDHFQQSWRQRMDASLSRGLPFLCARCGGRVALPDRL